MTSASEIVLTGIGKHFGPVRALDQVDLRLRPGRVHALLGENGAGKSTLMGVLFGLVIPDSGSLAIDGTHTVFHSPRDAIRAGLGMVQQHFSHVPALTVAENVAMGGRGSFDPRSAERRVNTVAAAAGLALDPAARVGDLPVGAQQRLEIVRALAHDARVVILDEPTAVLSPSEASDLLQWIRRFADDGGVVALVTHKVREAIAVADDVTVLRTGRCVAAGTVDAFTAPSLTDAMFSGAVPVAPPARATHTAHRVVVSAHHLTIDAPRGQVGIRDANFEIRSGEVVGVAAVEGAGHAMLLRALAGLEPAASGSLLLPSNISFIPSDRHRDALLLDAPLYENLALHHAANRRGIIAWNVVRARTRTVMERFDVRADSERSAARTLSGGNQQRFVLGRELESRPPLVVADNPTRGLDLMATTAIHTRLLDAAAEGTAVVVYSGDLDEILTLVDRMLVVHQGDVRELPVVRDVVARGMVGDW